MPPAPGLDVLLDTNIISLCLWKLSSRQDNLTTVTKPKLNIQGDWSGIRQNWKTHTHTHAHKHTQPFYGSLNFVSRYQKKHSPTHTYHGHQSSLMCFLHLLWSMASSLFNLHAWQSFSTISLQVFFSLPLGVAPPLHTPYIYSPNHCLLFTAHAHTITWKTHNRGDMDQEGWEHESRRRELPTEPRMGQAFTYWRLSLEDNPVEGFRDEADTSISSMPTFNFVVLE